MDAEGHPRTRSLEELSEIRRVQIERGIRSTSLDYDSYNSWMSLFYVVDTEGIARLSELLHYVDFVRESRGDKLAEQIIEMSDAGAIERYDELVDRFNADLPRMRDEGDVAAVRRFHDEANKLIRNK